MAGKFEVYEDKAGRWRFRLKASNGQVIAVGEAHQTEAAAKKGCECVMRAVGVPDDAIAASGGRGPDTGVTRAAIEVVDS